MSRPSARYSKKPRTRAPRGSSTQAEAAAEVRAALAATFPTLKVSVQARTSQPGKWKPPSVTVRWVDGPSVSTLLASLPDVGLRVPTWRSATPEALLYLAVELGVGSVLDTIEVRRAWLNRDLQDVDVAASAGELGVLLRACFSVEEPLDVLAAAACTTVSTAGSLSAAVLEAAVKLADAGDPDASGAHRLIDAVEFAVLAVDA